MPTALITGITGQDGSYLAELLLTKGYTVHGIVRRSSTVGTRRLEHLYDEPQHADRPIQLHYGDMSDSGSLRSIIERTQPDEVYNLAAQSHVQVSFEVPEFTADVTAIGALRLLEALRDTGSAARFYQASSSEMFGATSPPQSETSRFHPRSPYAAAKAFAHYCTVNYREAYDMFATSGILFNHESPRRGRTFVTRKISHAVAEIATGKRDTLYLGNLDAKRDWGFAGDYVHAMWMMLQADQPTDYVIGTGHAHSVQDFCQAAFTHVGLDWHNHVQHDPRYDRPTEVDHLLANPQQAQTELGWKPSVDFTGLVTMMVDNDLATIQASSAT